MSNDIILWYSTEDGSWGGCERGNLVIVPLDALTDDENAALGYGNDGEAEQIILDVAARLEAKDVGA